MVTSNLELQRATKLQVDSFVTELRSVGAELRTVTNRLEGIATTLQGLKQVMEKQVLTQETITAVEQAEAAMKIARMKPVIYVKVQLTGWNFFADLRQHQLMIYNSGGDVREVFVAVGVVPLQDNQTQFGPWAVSSNAQVVQNIGPAKAFGGATELMVSINCRDAERRGYAGTAQVRLGADWSLIQLALSER